MPLKKRPPDPPKGSWDQLANQLPSANQMNLLRKDIESLLERLRVTASDGTMLLRLPDANHVVHDPSDIGMKMLKDCPYAMIARLLLASPWLWEIANDYVDARERAKGTQVQYPTPDSQQAYEARRYNDWAALLTGRYNDWAALLTPELQAIADHYCAKPFNNRDARLAMYCFDRLLEEHQKMGHITAYHVQSDPANNPPANAGKCIIVTTRVKFPWAANNSHWVAEWVPTDMQNDQSPPAQDFKAEPLPDA